MKKLLYLFIYLCPILLLITCKKEAIKVLSTVNTTPATNITSTTATSGGSITNDGGALVTSRGVCWSLNQSPTTSDNKTSDGSGVGSFTSSIVGLSPGGTYYVRAYATNSVGTAYGSQTTITTISTLPVLTTTELLGISSTTATGGGNITSDGGSSVIARGVCWSKNPLPTANRVDSVTVNGMGTGIFTSSITGLNPGATYYLRAYATNSIGTGYGNQLSFTTSAIIPTLTTTTITDIGATNATSGGNITSDGGSTVTSRGVCWSINQSPTISDNKSTNGTGTGSFISSINNLLPGTRYYVRAYANNSAGTAYGNQETFVTNTAIPTVTTTTTTNITSTGFTCGGNVISDGGSIVTARGICWSTNQNPTILDNITLNGSDIGSFTSTISGLTPGTTYYIKAYATNSIGTSYGILVSVQTNAILPVVTTIISSNITSTTAPCGGNVISDGGAPVIARGICWSTNQNPTISDNKTSDGVGIGEFSTLITGLTRGTTYNIKAYATNSVGTAYGGRIGFTTPLYSKPTIVTLPITEITSISAMGGYNITSDGGSPITRSGITFSGKYGTTTLATSSGVLGIHTDWLGGLHINTTYTVVTFATNIMGTSYGEEIIFITDVSGSPTVVDIDGNVYHTVPIGTQIWMIENLKTTKYKDGTSIPNVIDNVAWSNLITPGYCWYNNDITYKSTYGALYNWYSVNTGKLCPTGWHVPTDGEWTVLTSALCGKSNAGGKMKEEGTAHWESTNSDATNSSGFTALPGGTRPEDIFYDIGRSGYWWSASSTFKQLLSTQKYIWSATVDVGRGLSVRCVKD